VISAQEFPLQRVHELHGFVLIGGVCKSSQNGLESLEKSGLDICL